MNPLQPQALEFDASGQPYCSRYADTYASRDGALGQARHVFLAGNGLPQRWAERQQFVIVETGFGLGTNFLATWQAWREDSRRPQRLHFVSVELHPLPSRDLQSPRPSPPLAPPRDEGGPLAPADTPPVGSPPEPTADLRSQLAAQWPVLVAGLHRLQFDEGRVVLTLALGDALELLPQLQLGADAFYLDGFAPDRNPRMWDPRLLRALARLARADATAASYTCARAVRDGLTQSGFAVQLQPGFAGKRQMLTARFAPRWKLRRHDPPPAYEGERRAIVVGAGLAGCSTVYALRQRGWWVTLIERGPQPAAAASGLPAGLLRPALSADDNRASRLSRAGFLYGLAQLRRLGAQADARETGKLWSPCGVFEQARSAREASVTKARLARQAWPEQFAVFLETAQAAAHLGLAPRHGGTWFARGAVVAAARWCRALLQEHALARPAPPLTLVLDFDVGTLWRTEHGWCVSDAQGRRHEAPVLVLANAFGMTTLPPTDHLPLVEIEGRISLLAAPALRDLRAGISGDGYLVPPLLDGAAVGASYEPVAGEQTAAADPIAADPSPPEGHASAHAHRANLQRLARLLAQPLSAQIGGVFCGRRCVSRDHLPVAGALPDAPTILRDAARYRGAQLRDLPRLSGLFCLSALGSRGLALAPLLGEHLASLIAGEPAPIEAALSSAVDPARFLLRALR